MWYLPSYQLSPWFPWPSVCKHMKMELWGRSEVIAASTHHHTFGTHHFHNKFSWVDFEFPHAQSQMFPNMYEVLLSLIPLSAGIFSVPLPWGDLGFNWTALVVFKYLLDITSKYSMASMNGSQLAVGKEQIVPLWFILELRTEWCHFLDVPVSIFCTFNSPSSSCWTCSFVLIMFDGPIFKPFSIFIQQWGAELKKLNDDFLLGKGKNTIASGSNGYKIAQPYWKASLGLVCLCFLFVVY